LACSNAGAPSALPDTNLVATLNKRLVDRYADDPALAVVAAPLELEPFHYFMFWHPRPRLEQFAGGSVVAEVVDGDACGVDREGVERLGLDDLEVVEFRDGGCRPGAIPARMLSSNRALTLRARSIAASSGSIRMSIALSWVMRLFAVRRRCSSRSSCS
jgi:hypothetical protein